MVGLVQRAAVRGLVREKRKAKRTAATVKVHLTRKGSAILERFHKQMRRAADTPIRTDENSPAKPSVISPLLQGT